MQIALSASAAKSQRPFNTWDMTKLIALGLMFVDHAGYFYYPSDLWLRAIGRGAAPIFMFLAGFAASYRFKLDLFLLAALMTVADIAMQGHIHDQNILFSILIFRMIFDWLERHGR